MAVLSPKESGEFIQRNAKHVKVIPSGIEKLSDFLKQALLTNSIGVGNFSQHELHPNPNVPNAVDWIFLIDTLNFCFWSPSDYTKYKVGGQTGYFALCAAIKRAIDEGIDITNPRFYANISLEALEKILRSDDNETKIPLLEERVRCLHEVGKCLNEKWNGSFLTVLREANKSAKTLIQLIVEQFPCFRDEAEYCGQLVALYKRAQILVGDIWSCFNGEGYGAFTDLDCVTMFADYRVPQVLLHFGCLEYSPEMIKRLNSDEIMQNGDPMEVEIRGASIYIVEKLKDLTNINSIKIDHFLWDYRRQHADELEHIPFHKVLSIYY